MVPVLLRRKVPALRLPGTLIAAAAMDHVLAPDVKNRRDFQQVREMRLR